MDSQVSIARIVKARGIRGEVAAELLTDFPQRFEQVGQVSLYSPSGEFVETLERYWFHKGRVILKFEGRDNPDQVQELIGCEVRIPETERVVLPDDTYFDSDLTGCEIQQDGETLGWVDSVLKVGEMASNLVVLDPQGREFMIPLVSEFVLCVDVDAGVIAVRLPPGLTDLAVERSPRS